MLGSAKTNRPLLTLTSWVKGTSPFAHSPEIYSQFQIFQNSLLGNAFVLKLVLFSNATKFCPTTNLYFSLMGWIEATVLSLAFSTNKKNNFFCVYARIFKIGIDWKDRDNAFWNKQKHLVGRERPYGTAETRPRHSSYYSIDGVREPLPSMTEATSMDRGGTCRKRSLDSFFLLKIKV